MDENEKADTTFGDRRRWERQPVDADQTLVWLSLTSKVDARMLDTSEGGATVLVPTSQPFEIGFQVRLQTGDRKRIATVENISRHESGAFRLGLTWVDNLTSV